MKTNLKNEMKTIIAQLKNDSQDKTLELRGLVEGDFDVLKFPSQRIHAEGMILPNSVELKYNYIGEFGVVRIDGKKDKTFEGGIFYVKNNAIQKDFIYRGFGPRTSIRSFWKIIKSENLVFSEIETEGSNHENSYDPFYAFEHNYDTHNCKNIIFKNCISRKSWGDGFYLREYNENITFLDCVVESNGRQAFAMVEGKNVYFKNPVVKNSRRSGIDLEPNISKQTISNVIIKGGSFNTRLLPFPMGGQGTVENILVEGNVYESMSPTTYVFADGIETFRRNIIFRNNKRIGQPYGSNAYDYEFHGVENLLIESNESILAENRSRKVIYLNRCKNVVIRNNDFVNAKYIILKNTDPSEVKVYGNKQDLFYKVYEENENAFTAHVIDPVPFEEYDVEKYGKPDVPQDPTWEGLVEPEPPVEPIPEPEKPTDPTPEVPQEPPSPEPPVEPKPPVEQPEKSKEWYENKLLWVVGGIVLVIILALVL